MSKKWLVWLVKELLLLKACFLFFDQWIYWTCLFCPASCQCGAKYFHQGKEEHRQTITNPDTYISDYIQHTHQCKLINIPAYPMRRRHRCDIRRPSHEAVDNPPLVHSVISEGHIQRSPPFRCANSRHVAGNHTWNVYVYVWCRLCIYIYIHMYTCIHISI